MSPRPTTRRRAIKWAALLLGVPVLLLSSYVSAWLAVSRAAHQGIISGPTTHAIVWVFEPIKRYSGSNKPGARQLSEAWYELNPSRHVNVSTTTFRGTLTLRSPAIVLAPDHRAMGFVIGPNERLVMGIPLVIAAAIIFALSRRRLHDRPSR